MGDPSARATGASISEETTSGLMSLDRYAAVRARMARWIEPPSAPPPSLASLLDGTSLRQAPSGPALVRERRYPLSDCHGNRPLAGFFAHDPVHLEVLTADPRLEGFDPSRSLFIDIEATGLDHGAGTLAFVIGLGFRDEDHFVVQQLILQEPAGERAMLECLVATIERFDYLVSFNGKSYDLSVLQSRLVMAGLYDPRQVALKLRPHLDLLHMSRNLYRDRYPDTRLQTLERQLLGLDRVDDIPGSMVPACWFAFLRHGQTEPLAGVCKHNLDDVLTMVTLADAVIADSALGAGPTEPRLALNLGRLLARRKHFLAAAEVLRAAVGDAATEQQALWIKATCARRMGDHEARLDWLDRLTARYPDVAEAQLELAIVCERLGLLHRARVAAEAAYHLAPSDEGARRLSRLDGRIARQARQSG